MLIRSAEIWRGATQDVRTIRNRVAAIGKLQREADEPVLEADGCALLPGLHDHHIHLAATSAAMQSVDCGPPHVNNAGQLAIALAQTGTGWLRGTAYHESVAGVLTRKQIDAWQCDRPVRVQHRSGRMWFFNSAALALLRDCADIPAGIDFDTGQAFEIDDWLRGALSSRPPDLSVLSRTLAAHGVTGVTEISPSNSHAEARWLGQEIEQGNLLQHCVLAGRLDLSDRMLPHGIALGPLKLHLHEHQMPDFDLVVDRILVAHWLARPVAVHCTTEVELVFTLAALAETGTLAGDRIEHAGIASDALIEQMAALKLIVVSQPHFIAERGDQYRHVIPPSEHSLLYRLRSFIGAGVPLAAGSDAPYGSTNPWTAMSAACSRRTRNGHMIGAKEALSPEQALSLYLRDPLNLTVERRIAVSGPADLCLLDRPWAAARADLSAVAVRATLFDGSLVYDRVDKSPVERRSGADAAA